MSLLAAEIHRIPRRGVGDRIFRALALGSGLLVLALLGAVVGFLALQGLPALTQDLTAIAPGQDFVAYVGPLVFGTVWASLLALGLAVPASVAVALFVTHYAPMRWARPFGHLVDLLAAIPSVVFGLWGITVLAPTLGHSVFPWLEHHLGFLPFFAGPTARSGRTILTASVVLAVMILPLITALCREAFLQVPARAQEGSLALGATRWEMVRMVVLPASRSAIVSAAMLGLGRALGETMAVAMVLSPADVMTVNVLSAQNPNTIAANIALKFPESSGLATNRLVATGLVLFVITCAVNLVARRVRSHSRTAEEGQP